MRYKNETGDLKLYAVAGTQTVLLSMDIAKSKIGNKKFLGFDIVRTDKNGKQLRINGSKHFSSVIHDATVTDPKIKFLSLIQSFFWKDYLADPGQTYTYTVNAVTGTPKAHADTFTAKIKVTTEELYSDKHSVFFNFGVTGSQGYERNFHNKPISSFKGADREKVLNYLGRELWQDGLIKYVQQAKDNTFQLFCAFYELQFPDFLQELKAAKNRGVHVEIVFSNQPSQKVKNNAAIKAAGIASICHPRTKANQPHNKFMVLCKNNKPVQVWTGSTNITQAGIFGQSNTGHWFKDAAIAEKYLNYWNLLKDNPDLSKLADVSEAQQADTDLTKLKDGVYLFLSPRHSTTHLGNYAKLIDSAKELVCMVFPFNIDDVFKKVYREDKDYLRFLLFEKAAQAKSVKSNDTDLKITAGAILDKEVKEKWVKEVSAKSVAQAGILYVHNKFFLIDPLGKDPVVVSGSANFSKSSMTGNDENSLLIKGDKRVADIYLTEFNRLFEHFWPRYLKKINAGKKNTAQGFEKPLDETYTWFNVYFDKTKFGYKRKVMFAKMQDAKKG